MDVLWGVIVVTATLISIVMFFGIDWAWIKGLMQPVSTNSTMTDPFEAQIPAYVEWKRGIGSLDGGAVLGSDVSKSDLRVEDVFTAQKIKLIKEPDTLKFLEVKGDIDTEGDEKHKELKSNLNSAEFGQDDDAAFNFQDFLQKNRLTVILGDPGMGKSTLAAHLIIDQLSKLEKSALQGSKKTELDTIFPIIISYYHRRKILP